MSNDKAVQLQVPQQIALAVSIPDQAAGDAVRQNGGIVTDYVQISAPAFDARVLAQMPHGTVFQFHVLLPQLEETSRVVGPDGLPLPAQEWKRLPPIVSLLVPAVVLRKELQPMAEKAKAQAALPALLGRIGALLGTIANVNLLSPEQQAMIAELEVMCGALDAYLYEPAAPPLPQLRPPEA